MTGPGQAIHQEAKEDEMSLMTINHSHYVPGTEQGLQGREWAAEGRRGRTGV